MEEFDHQIKSKINYLESVPGVEFDEEKTWRKIKPRIIGGSFLLFGLIVLLSFLTIIYLTRYESQIESVAYKQAKEITSKGLIKDNIFLFESSNVADKIEPQNPLVSNTIQTKSVIPIIHKREIDSAKYNELKLSKKPKRKIVKSAPNQQKKKVLRRKQNTFMFESLNALNNKKMKELSFSVGRHNQSIGISYLKKINKHFHLTYGLSINRNFDSRLKTNEKRFAPYSSNQIQIPLGIRYNLLNYGNRFRSHLSADFQNSFSTSSYKNNVAYKLSFESHLNLDYRIFSTKNGKNGYFRFRLPIYNKSIINQGEYKLDFYDVLKK